MNDKNTRTGKYKSRLLGFKIIRLILIIAIILLAFYVLKKANIFQSKEGEIRSLESKSNLQEILEISDLSTISYTYNSIASVIDPKSELEKYHVAYEGEIRAGIDFTKIKIEVDDKQKVIRVLTPQAEIQDVLVDMESLDFIFNYPVFETEDVTQEAYKVCLKDLKDKAQLEKNILEIAEQNSKSTLKALIEPIIDTEYQDYSLSIR